LGWGSSKEWRCLPNQVKIGQIPQFYQTNNIKPRFERAINIKAEKMRKLSNKASASFAAQALGIL
jgi:hypothetical protein